MEKVLKIMKYAPIVLYVLWAIIGICAACAGHWVVGLSWLWMPLTIIFFALLVISLAWAYGDLIKARSPKTCENCIFAKQRELQGQCIGEKLGEAYGKPCRCYARYHYDRPGTEIDYTK